MRELRRDTLDEEDYKILDLGWDDRLEEKRKSDNPFAITNWKYYEWEKGWQMADDNPSDSDSD